MDPFRIAARVVVAYIVLLVLVRLSGKHTVKQANPFDFTLSLILGDLVDDAIWAEVEVPVFFAAAGMLTLTHAVLDGIRYRIGARH